MAHFVRTHTDSEWTNGGGGGYVTVESDWESLDGKVFGSVNGDRGGVWAPSTPIIFGDVANPASPSLVVEGPTLVAWGGSIRTLSGGRFIHTPTTIPRLGSGHVGQTRKILTSCIGRLASPPYTWISVDGSNAIQSIALTVAEYQGGEGVSVTTFFGSTDIVSVPFTKALVQPSFHLPLDVHDGATFSTATFTFRVGSPRSAGPVALPKFRIIAIDETGNILPLKKTDDGTGYVSPPSPTGGNDWYAGGAAQTFVYTCDQNNIIDISRYHYEAQVVEEAGALTFPTQSTSDGVLVLTKKESVVCATTANLTGFPAYGLNPVGGYTPADGDHVLVKDQTDPTQNGIWIAHPNPTPGSWERVPGALATVDFVGNWIVAVGGNGTNALSAMGSHLGEVWQLANDGPVAFDSTGKCLTPIRFRRRIPAGNIYHSVLCEFDGIVDLRIP